LGVVLLLCAVFSAGSTAQPGGTISAGTYRVLQKAERLAAEQDLNEAISLLERRHARRSGKVYETAVLLRALAVMHLMRDDLGQAADYLQRSLDTGALPEDIAHQAEYDLASLYGATGQHARAETLLERWFQSETAPSAEAYILLANTYIQQQKLGDAITPLRKAIATSDRPREPWLQVLLAALHDLGQLPEATEVLFDLIASFEKREYWLQLAGVYQLRRDLNQAASALRMAHQRGFITEAEHLKRLAHLHLYLDLPYEAAGLIESALANDQLPADKETYRLMSHSWLRAREHNKAIDALRDLAKVDQDGDVLLRLGRVYLANARWADAAEALRLALMREDLDDAGSANRLLGLALYELGENDQPGAGATTAGLR
jgi:tetratricopeptide (TPR) repeat protein